jgi:asparagine synthase (glutamine-hydrolysing)
MCGISGIINLSGEEVDQNQLKIMNDLVAHRGPDGEGFYVDSIIGFGHRRLSIIDLTTQGNQPMHYMDNLTITYNGEIYNYIEVKEKLSDAGYIFNSKTDTEVVLAAYDYWGEECVQYFNGMWSFAIHDKKSEKVFMSRDRFGIKPFYYKKTSFQFLFGSEIKQLLNIKENKGNESIILDYLILGYEEHTSDSFFDGVNKLPAGHNIIYSTKDNTFQTKPYYTLDVNDLDPLHSIEDAVNEYKSTFLSSIELRLRSDVNVGSSLSGGLDSSSIVTLASKEYFLQTKQNFNAFHINYIENQKKSELSFVKELNEMLPLNLCVINVEDHDIVDKIDRVIKIQEEPFGGPSVILQNILMEKVKEENCPVLLDGQGGDETLLGYERYYVEIFWSLPFFSKFSFFFEVVRKSKLNTLTFVKYIIYFKIKWIRKQRVIRQNKGLYNDKTITSWKKSLNNKIKVFSSVFELQRNELFSLQLPHLLKYEDKNAMSYSIETRVPFVDHRNVETALSIDSELKIKNGWSKYILRKIMDKIMPDSLVWRKDKIGFELDEDHFFKIIEKEFFELLIESEIAKKLLSKNQNADSLRRLSTRHKWRLYNLIKWEKEFNVYL